MEDGIGARRSGRRTWLLLENRVGWACWVLGRMSVGGEDMGGGEEGEGDEEAEGRVVREVRMCGEVSAHLCFVGGCDCRLHAPLPEPEFFRCSCRLSVVATRVFCLIRPGD